jgi:hypothetical protein
VNQVKVSEIRAKFPMYGDKTDDELLLAVRKKFYPEMPLSEFAKRVDFDTERSRMSPLGSDGENYWAGVGRGASNIAVGIKQRMDEAAAALERLVPGGANLSRLTGTKTAAEIRDIGQSEINESRQLDKPLMSTKAGVAGDITGTLLAGAPAGGLGALEAGLALGYTTPTTSDESVVKNTAVGAVSSLVGDKLIRGASRVVSPKTAPEAKLLADQGVQMTPGQILGGAANKWEERATSLPFVGDAISKARRSSAESLNTTAINRALEPIGEKLPKNALGRDAIKHVDEVLGKAYDDILPKLTTQADDQFVSEVRNLYGMVQGGNMGAPEAAQFSKILESNLKKFQGQNAITGETLKSMESELGRLGSAYMRDPSADKRQLGTAIVELQSSLRDLVQRSNPEYAKELKAINKAWANFKRVQRASASVAAEDGVFSAAQLHGAVKAMDKSKDKAAFARGSALMQDLSEPAKKILGDKVPDSGTAGRLANVGAMAGLAVEPSIPLGLMGSSLLYSGPAMTAAQKALINRPEGAKKLAKRLEDLGPLAALLGYSSTSQIGK